MSTMNTLGAIFSRSILLKYRHGENALARTGMKTIRSMHPSIVLATADINTSDYRANCMTTHMYAMLTCKPQN